MKSSLCSLGQQGHSKAIIGDVHLCPHGLLKACGAEAPGKIAIKVARGLANTHAKAACAIIHRDFEPRSLMHVMCVQVAVDNEGGSGMHAQKAGVPSTATSSRGVSCMCYAHADRGGCRAGPGVHARKEGGRHHPPRPQAGQPHGFWFDVPCAVRAQPPDQPNTINSFASVHHTHWRFAAL